MIWQGGRQGGGGLKPPQILSSCYYVYKQLPQKYVKKLSMPLSGSVLLNLIDLG